MLAEEEKQGNGKHRRNREKRSKNKEDCMRKVADEEVEEHKLQERGEGKIDGGLRKNRNRITWRKWQRRDC